MNDIGAVTGVASTSVEPESSPQPTNAEVAIEFFNSCQDLVTGEDKPDSIVSILYRNLPLMILSVQTAPSAYDLEYELFDLVEAFAGLAKVLQTPQFGNPTMEELQEILADKERSEHLRKQLAQSDARIIELVESLAAEKAVSEQLRTDFQALRIEADNVAERMLREIKDPNSSIFRAINRVVDSNRSLDSALSTKLSHEATLIAELEGFTDKFVSSLPERTVVAGSSDHPVETIHLEIATLRDTLGKISESMKVNYELLERIEKRILPRLETRKEARMNNRYDAGRFLKCAAVIEQIQRHSEALLKIESEVKSLYDQRVSILVMLGKDRTEMIIPVIPDLSIDLSAVPIAQTSKAAGKQKTQAKKAKLVKDKVVLEWHEVFTVPTDTLASIAAQHNMHPVEVYICTIFDIVSQGVEREKLKHRSLFKLIWATGRAGIVLNQAESVHTLSRGWGGNKAEFFANHPQVRSLLDPKPMGTPAFKRTDTRLPWRPHELFTLEQIKSIKLESERGAT